jgi:hypothetical protein
MDKQRIGKKALFATLVLFISALLLLVIIMTFGV